MAKVYKQYKKGVKKLGGKQIATRKEFAIIQQRLDKIYGNRTKTTRALKRSGLTQKEINRLRGK